VRSEQSASPASRSSARRDCVAVTSLRLAAGEHLVEQDRGRHREVQRAARPAHRMLTGGRKRCCSRGEALAFGCPSAAPCAPVVGRRGTTRRAVGGADDGRATLARPRREALEGAAHEAAREHRAHARAASPPVVQGRSSRRAGSPPPAPGPVARAQDRARLPGSATAASATQRSPGASRTSSSAVQRCRTTSRADAPAV